MAKKYDAKAVRRSVRAALRAGSTLEHLAVLMDLMPDAAQAGRETDADAIVLVTPIDGGYATGILVGRSILCGPDAFQYLLDYHSQDMEATHVVIDRFAGEAADMLKKVEFASIIIRDTTDEWRSFRSSPPPTVDEVRARLGR